MPTIKIVGYQTGFQKVALSNLLQEALELDLAESNKMTDTVMSGNVISLDFEDKEFALNLSEELTEAGARVKFEDDAEDSVDERQK